MPRRSNDFQNLVALIERALAPKGARVTESALVPGLDEDSRREIDVLIESRVGPYLMKLAVEAKDEKRKMDTVKFESIIAKYSSRSGISVNKIVVVSRAGFCKDAYRRAQREGIQLLTLSEALVADWAKNAPQKLHVSVAPHLAHFEFQPPIGGDASSHSRRAPFVCSCCGRSRGTPFDLATQCLRDPDLMHEVRVTASRSGGPVCVRFEFTIPEQWMLRIGDGMQRVDQLSAYIHCTEARTKLDVAAYHHMDAVVHHLSGKAAGQKIEFVLPDGHESENVAVKLSNAEAPNVTTPAKGEVDEPTVAPPPPAEALPVLDSIRGMISGLDASLESPALIHDFSTGEDVAVDGLVKVYIAKTSALRAAIVFDRGGTKFDEAAIERWAALATGAELDRLILVGAHAVALPSTRAAAAYSPIRLKTNAVELGDLIPSVFLWSCALLDFEATVYTREGKLPKNSTVAEIHAGEMRLRNHLKS